MKVPYVKGIRCALEVVFRLASRARVGADEREIEPNFISSERLHSLQVPVSPQRR
jgi:hypothetical protein